MNEPFPIRTLTVLSEKARNYRAEVFFRETWDEISMVWDSRAVELTHSHAAMLFKPDGVAARVIAPTVEFLGENGFTPVVATTVDLDRHTTRWLWLYRFNVASVERVRLHDLVNTAGPGLLMIFRDDRHLPGEVPATVRLTDLKGPSRPERRRPDQLRSRLGGSDRLVNYVHTSDEPADLVREIGILIGPKRRQDFVAAIGAPSPASDAVLDAQRMVEAALPQYDFEADEATRRIGLHADEALVGGQAQRDGVDWHLVRELADAASGGDEAAARNLWVTLRSGDTSVPRWDLVRLGSRTIDYDEPGVDAQTLGDAPPEAWRAAAVVEVGR